MDDYLVTPPELEHRPGCPCAHLGGDVILVRVAAAFLPQLSKGWSEPLRVRVTPQADGTWEMVAESVV